MCSLDKDSKEIVMQFKGDPAELWAEANMPSEGYFNHRSAVDGTRFTYTIKCEFQRKPTRVQIKEGSNTKPHIIVLQDHYKAYHPEDKDFQFVANWSVVWRF